MNIAINNAWVVDFEGLTFNRLSVGIKDEKIVKLAETPLKAKETIDATGMFLSTGLIDCHCHIESTYLTPRGFAESVVGKGTLFVVADCHEIANVFGKSGIEFFIEDAKDTPVQIKFAVPSCVPATDFATSGGRIDVEDVRHLLEYDEVVSLGELMNVPGVVGGDPKFKEMIKLAKIKNKRVSGHAPDLDPETLKRYREAGVEDDHESYSYSELKTKIEMGFFVFLREGSTESSSNDAYKIIKEYPDRVAFCTDDKSVKDINLQGHIDFNLRKAIKLGVEPALALKVASFNGLKYYGLDEFSSIEKGNKAYLVLFDKDFYPKTIITNGEIYKPYHKQSIPPQHFLHSIHVKTPVEIPEIKYKNLAIGVKEGSLITEKLEIQKQNEEFNIDNDLLKLIVIERYGKGNKSAAFVKGFNLKNGALASSLSHDCHNIVAVGTSDEYLKKAVEKIIELQGGQVVVGENFIETLELPIGGIVADEKTDLVEKRIERLRSAAKRIGCKLKDPFGSLSFLALEVIPHLKLTDRGLFDVDTFKYIGEEDV